MKIKFLFFTASAVMLIGNQNALAIECVAGAANESGGVQSVCPGHSSAGPFFTRSSCNTYCHKFQVSSKSTPIKTISTTHPAPSKSSANSTARNGTSQKSVAKQVIHAPTKPTYSQTRVPAPLAQVSATAQKTERIPSSPKLAPSVAKLPTRTATLTQPSGTSSNYARPTSVSSGRANESTACLDAKGVQAQHRSIDTIKKDPGQYQLYDINGTHHMAYVGDCKDNKSAVVANKSGTNAEPKTPAGTTSGLGEKVSANSYPSAPPSVFSEGTNALGEKTGNSTDTTASTGATATQEAGTQGSNGEPMSYQKQHALNLKEDGNTGKLSLASSEREAKKTTKQAEVAEASYDRASRKYERALEKEKNKYGTNENTPSSAKVAALGLKQGAAESARSAASANNDKAADQFEKDSTTHALRAAKTNAKTIDAITEQGDAVKGDCGKYGGANCKKTSNMNGMIAVGQMIGSSLATGAVNTAGNNAANTVAAKGMNATQTDIAEGQLKTAKASIKGETMISALDTFAIYKQTMAARQHNGSLEKIEGTAQSAKTSVLRWDGESNQYQKSAAFTDAYNRAQEAQSGAVRARAVEKLNECLTALASTHVPCKTLATYVAETRVDPEFKDHANQVARDAVIKNINENNIAEQGKQQGIAQETMKAALTSAGDLANHIKSINATRGAMKVIAATAGAANNGFNYNPGAGNPNDPDGNSNTPPDNGGTVDNTTGDGPGLDPGNQQINPGLQDPGIGGAGGEGKFVAAPPPGGGAGGAGSLGSSGGTSAAKDDGAAKEGGPSKQQAGGGYASDGPAGGSGYRGSGSGAGVGVDTSFADMLKKFLPGGEEDKKKDEKAMAFDDRSPASDQAAVIGRNKNIFEEIHKRYQKKSGEGAIIF